MIEVTERLNSIIGSFAQEAIDFTEDLDLIRDANFDSIELMEMIVVIEFEFGIEFSYEMLQYDMLTSYKHLRDYICRRVGDDNGVA